MDDLKLLLNKVLDAISFDSNREEFINNFLQLCAEQTVLELISSLPDDQKGKFKQQCQQKTDPQEIKAIILTFFNKEQYNQTVTKTSSELFTSFFKELEPSLNDNQKQQLTALASTPQSA